MNNHPNKHIREAVDYALAHGWRLGHAGPRAHIWGLLFCPHVAGMDVVGRFYPRRESPSVMHARFDTLSTTAPTSRVN